jgi:hypothetical protein
MSDTLHVDVRGRYIFTRQPHGMGQVHTSRRVVCICITGLRSPEKTHSCTNPLASCKDSWKKTACSIARTWGPKEGISKRAGPVTRVALILLSCFIFPAMDVFMRELNLLFDCFRNY